MANDRAEANYFSTVFFIFIAVLLLAFIIDLFSIISTKQELDHAADQMVKQIQPWNVPGWMIYSGISVKNTDLSWINAIWFCMVTADAAKMNKDRKHSGDMSRTF